MEYTEAVFDALNRAGVAYLVVGGLAVNAHGYVRMTMDIDLVIALNPEHILKALITMEREAGRSQDLADIDALLEIADHGG